MDRIIASGFPPSRPLLIAAGAGAAASVLWYLWWEAQRAQKWPPLAKGPKFTLWENIKNFAINPDNSPILLEEAAKEYGPVFRLNIPGPPAMVCIADAEMAKGFLESNLGDKSTFHKEFEAIQNSPSIFTRDTTDKAWLVARKGAAPAFSNSSLNRVHGRLLSQISRLTSMLDDHERTGDLVDLPTVFTRLTMDVLFATMFDEEGGSLDGTGDGARLLELIPPVMVEINAYRAMNPLRKYMLFLPGVRGSNAKMREINKICQRILDGYRNSRSQEEIAADAGVLSHLVRIPYKNDTERLADLVSFVIAGYDTTAFSLSWIFKEIAEHPEAVDKMRKELDVINPSRGMFSHEQLDQLSYTEWVIKEGLRMWPVAVGVIRDTTREGTIGGFTVPKGAQVFVVFNVISRHGVRDGMKFMPERWEASHPDTDLLARVTEGTTFGLGKRNCVGQSLAKREMVRCAFVWYVFVHDSALALASVSAFFVCC